MLTVADDRGRRVAMPVPPRRVVSLVPSISEMLFALGRGDLVCGATRYCVEPGGQMGHVTRVGGTKDPDLATIASLAPDLVLVSPEENRWADFEALKGAGLRVFVVDPRRVADVPGTLRRIGDIVDARWVAERIAREVEAAIAEATGWAAEVRPRVFCPIWKDPWMSVNGSTFPGDVLRLAGANNVCGDAPAAYCTVTLDEIAALVPEVILLPDEPFAFAPEHLASLQPLGGTPALRDGRVCFVDGRALSWYGPRTAAALRTIRVLLNRRSD